MLENRSPRISDASRRIFVGLWPRFGASSWRPTSKRLGLVEFDVDERFGVPSNIPLAGISVDPITNERFILARDLWREGGERAWRQDDYPALRFTDLTDVTALGQGEFAVTMLSDGYLVNTTNHEATQHFCYEPCEPESGADEDWCMGTPDLPLQITHGLTFDDDNGLIIAQPQNVSESNMDEIWNAYLALYDRDSGDFLGWDALPFGYRAKGIAVMDDVMFLGRESELLKVRTPKRERFTPGKLQDVDILERLNLSSLGISDIQGLAVDVIQQKLLLLDGNQRSLIEIPLALLN